MVIALFGIAVLQLAVAAFQRRNRGASVLGSLYIVYCMDIAALSVGGLYPEQWQ